MSVKPNSIGRRMAKASGWTISTRFLIRGIGLVSTAILARLLVPEDFGLIAMGVFLHQIIQALSDFNFNTVLLVERKERRDYFDTVWTLSVVRGIVIAAALSIMAAPMARFFAEPRVETIVYVVSFVAVLEGGVNVGIINFLREFQFGRDLAYQVTTKLCSFTATIASAFLLGNYVALLIGMSVAALARLVLSYIMHPYRPKVSLARWQELFRFSRWLLLANLCRSLYLRADVFFISRLVGVTSLGVYTLATETSMLPAEMLIQPARRAFLPGFTKLAHDIQQLRAVFLDGLGLIALFVMPAALGLALTADALVRVFLGSVWIDAIPLIQVLAFALLFRSILPSAHPLYLALGRPHLVSISGLATLGIGVPLVGVGTYLGGTLGAAYMIVAMGAINLVINLALTTRLIDLSLGMIVSPLLRTAIATAVMSVPMIVVARFWGDPSALHLLIGKLAAQVAVGLASFLVTQLLLWKLSGFSVGPESHVLDVLWSWIAKRKNDLAVLRASTVQNHESGVPPTR